jgi:hypothetical protein
MKKIMILFICFTLLFICSCRKKQNDEPVILIDVIESTIKEVYYIDEFNITSIKINVSIDGVSKEEILTPLLIENYPSKITEGSYTFIINYEGVKKEFTLNFIERETYTLGLEFSLNKNGNAYQVVNYKGTSNEVIIPSTFNYLPVTSIKSYAFDNNQTIKKVTLPSTIKEIESNAFSNSTIKEINIPSACEKIKDAAFYGCENLRSIMVPKTVKEIGEYALYNTIHIYTDSSDVSMWNEKAYDDNLVYIHKELDLSKILKENDFEYYIDETATLLNYNGVENIVEIKEQVNNYTIDKIGNSAFLKLDILEEITFSNSVVYIGDKAFRETSLTTVEIPSSVKEIGIYAFSGCEYLEEVVFNEGLEIIKMSAFAACANLKVAILPNSLHTIEQYGFQNCLRIEKVFIPKSVTYIGDYAFYACHKAMLYIEAESVPSTWHSNFSPSGAKKTFNASRDSI